MGKSQRTKGQGGEREIVDKFKAAGFSAYRTQQTGERFAQKKDADVVVDGLPYHIEVKRQETIKIHAWWAQAVDESDTSCKIPVVFFRRSREKWKCVIDADELIKLFKGG